MPARSWFLFLLFAGCISDGIPIPGGPAGLGDTAVDCGNLDEKSCAQNSACAAQTCPSCGQSVFVTCYDKLTTPPVIHCANDGCDSVCSAITDPKTCAANPKCIGAYCQCGWQCLSNENPYPVCACGGEADLGDVTPPSTKDPKSCTALARCYGQCSPTDDNCGFDCQGTARMSAAAKFDKAISCEEGHCLCGAAGANPDFTCKSVNGVTQSYKCKITSGGFTELDGTPLDFGNPGICAACMNDAFQNDLFQNANYVCHSSADCNPPECASDVQACVGN